MIVVKLEMWPFGDESAKYDIGEIRITNQGRSEGTGFSYRYVFKKAGKANGKRGGWKEGKIHNFPRKARNAYDLLFRVLDAVVGERNVRSTKQGQ